MVGIDRDILQPASVASPRSLSTRRPPVGAPTEIDLIHANLPAHVDTASAQLPQSYEAAKRALAECERIDECKGWSDKMAALASYARQVEDETLLKTAMRIHGRALRRVGELLKEFDGRPQNAVKQSRDTPTLISRREAAEQAGLSRDQQVAAVRIANVPAKVFEAAIESDSPPTITKLAEAGRKAREALGFDYLQGRDPQKFYAATHTLGALQRFAEKCAEHPPEFVAGGVGTHEVTEARKLVMDVDAWLNSFFARLEAGEP